jgi:hypothetical protein
MCCGRKYSRNFALLEQDAHIAHLQSRVVTKCCGRKYSRNFVLLNRMLTSPTYKVGWLRNVAAGNIHEISHCWTGRSHRQPIYKVGWLRNVLRQEIFSWNLVLTTQNFAEMFRNYEMLRQEIFTKPRPYGSKFRRHFSKLRNVATGNIPETASLRHEMSSKFREFSAISRNFAVRNFVNHPTTKWQRCRRIFNKSSDG